VDTETKLMATPEQCDELIKALQTAKRQAKENGEASYARVTLEQMSHTGPWRLIVGVFPPDGPNARG
jgi:hypothetical protein